MKKLFNFKKLVMAFSFVCLNFVSFFVSAIDNKEVNSINFVPSLTVKMESAVDSSIKKISKCEHFTKNEIFENLIESLN